MPRSIVVVALFALSLTLGLSRPGLASQAATPSAASGTPTTCSATTEEENAVIARRWHEDVINQRNPAALQEILDPQVTHHAAGGFPDVMTADGVAADLGAFLTAFSDLHITIDLLITQDDLVVERYTASGTQDGPLQDLPPSGRTATWTGINIFRIECGRISEVWSEVDALSRRQQLTGAIPATPEP
jgi:steroid delta-isomerase-like uncharacterized protein